MKARDIITGWPRPRSTLAWSCPWRIDLVFWIAMRGLDHADLKEFVANMRYHDAQQRMQDAYFERWRRPL